MNGGLPAAPMVPLGPAPPALVVSRTRAHWGGEPRAGDGTLGTTTLTVVDVTLPGALMRNSPIAGLLADLPVVALSGGPPRRVLS
jgi:hypothetical protein